MTFTSTEKVKASDRQVTNQISLKMINSDFAASKSPCGFGVHQWNLGTGSSWRTTH